MISVEKLSKLLESDNGVDRMSVLRLGLRAGGNAKQKQKRYTIRQW